MLDKKTPKCRMDLCSTSSGVTDPLSELWPLSAHVKHDLICTPDLPLSQP
jgi:hypothetical protein